MTTLEISSVTAHEISNTWDLENVEINNENKLLKIFFQSDQLNAEITMDTETGKVLDDMKN